MTELSLYADFHWPEAAALDPADMLLGYNPLADSLMVAFGGTNRPAYNEPLDLGPADYVSLRLDDETGEVVAVEVEAVRTRALRDYPAWRPVFEAAPSEPIMLRANPKVWPALSTFVADVVRLSREHADAVSVAKESATAR